MKKLLSKLTAAVLGTPAQRFAARQEIEVYIAPNAHGGWSIYPLNDAAHTLFAGTGPAGNFSSAAAAEDRARRHNCWTVKAVLSGATRLRSDELRRGNPDSLPAPAGMKPQQAPGARRGALSAASL